MQTMITHTQTPWEVRMHDTIYSSTGKFIADCESSHDRPSPPVAEEQANAAFIVQCVNSHAALVDLLRRLDQLNDAAHGGIADYHDVWDDVKAALALVQKGT